MSRVPLIGKEPLRAIVCGTSFGRFYLRALSSNPMVKLVGILSTGSQASCEYASEYGIAHYIDVADLPEDIELVCVVVRTSVSGGAGSDIARKLLGRGIHVLQEHPLHPAELADCFRAAQQNKVRYFVNSFYPYVSYIAQFLHTVSLLREQQPLLFVDAMCGSQVLYPLLDIIGRSVGSLRSCHVEVVEASRCQLYTTLIGEIAGVSLNLRVQNQIHPADADNHAFLLHRLAIGFEAGVLTLVDTHGPVIWSPRLHTHRDKTHRLVLSGEGTERLDVISSEILAGPKVTTFRSVFDNVWPDAINTALAEFLAELKDDRSALQTAQRTTNLTSLWQNVSRQLGQPVLIHPDAPREIRLAELVATIEHRGTS